MPLKTRKKSFATDNSAAVAVEFALIAPVLILMLFAIIEITGIMLANTVLESAVRVASRTGITGYTPNGMTRDQYVQQTIKDNLIYLNPNNLQFKTLVYDTFANIGQPEPYTDSNHNGRYDLGEPYSDVNGNGQWDADMGTSGAGGAGAIVVYKATYPWKVVTPLLSKFFSADGTLNITASMVVRNEPYDD